MLQLALSRCDLGTTETLLDFVASPQGVERDALFIRDFNRYPVNPDAWGKPTQTEAVKKVAPTPPAMHRKSTMLSRSVKTLHGRSFKEPKPDTTSLVQSSIAAFLTADVNGDDKLRLSLIHI